MIFVQAIGYTHSFEFQKCGLPHMHLLMILHSDDKKFWDPSKVDALVSAEFPSNIQHSELFKFVKTHVLHGPRGVLNPVCQCMKPDRNNNVTCLKIYPKYLRKATNVALTTYPQYRRRSNGSFASLNNVSI
jgi:hypothetical protein